MPCSSYSMPRSCRLKMGRAAPGRDRTGVVGLWKHEARDPRIEAAP